MLCNPNYSFERHGKPRGFGKGSGFHSVFRLAFSDSESFSVKIDAFQPSGIVRGSGKGGRNTELALAASIALDGWEHVLVMALATDGSDGPTNCAGAVATGTTCRRARALGMDAWAALQANDSYSFFAELGDLIQTGPTGTNVNDLLFVLVG